MRAMSLWSVRLAFGAALLLAAAAVGVVLGHAPAQDSHYGIALAVGFLALAFALRRGEAFAAWALGGCCAVYASLAAWLGHPLHVALVGLPLAVFVWAALDLWQLGVRVPVSVTWARAVVYLAMLEAGDSVGWLLSARPDAAANVGALLFETLLFAVLAFGVWRCWPWAAYALVGWHAGGVVLSIRTSADAAREAALLVLYAVGAYHVRMLARARRAADPSRRRSLAERLSRRGG